MNHVPTKYDPSFLSQNKFCENCEGNALIYCCIQEILNAKFSIVSSNNILVMWFEETKISSLFSLHVFYLYHWTEITKQHTQTHNFSTIGLR